MKISEHIHKIREFYVKDKNQWDTGALRTEDGYCLLGAAACVLTNKEAIDNGEEMGDWRELDEIKGERELLAFENFFSAHTQVGGVGMYVEDFNDAYQRTRSQVLTKLRNLETQALELGV